MAIINPFENEAEALSLGGLAIENRTDRVTVYGNLDITRDKAGLAHAQNLKKVVDLIVAALNDATDLPDQVAEPTPTKTVKNPFTC